MPGSDQLESAKRKENHSRHPPSSCAPCKSLYFTLLSLSGRFVSSCILSSSSLSPFRVSSLFSFPFYTYNKRLLSSRLTRLINGNCYCVRGAIVSLSPLASYNLWHTRKSSLHSLSLFLFPSLYACNIHHSHSLFRHVTW